MLAGIVRIERIRPAPQCRRNCSWNDNVKSSMVVNIHSYTCGNIALVCGYGGSTILRPREPHRSS